MFNRVVVIGTGLIGGSFCLAMRKAKLGHEILGYDIANASLDHALANNIIDRAAKDLDSALREANNDPTNLIVLALPLGATREVLKLCYDQTPSAYIMELGSAKNHLLTLGSLWRRNKVECRLVPAHPIAGSENNEIGSARADLFDNCKTVITPLPAVATSCVEKIGELWQRLGGDVFYMDLPFHDRVFAHTSHLPHLLAYTLMVSLQREAHLRGIPNYSAGGLRDFTRIAASDERMWNDIFEVNRPELLMALRDFQQSLAAMRQILQQGDTQKMQTTLREARRERYRIAGPPPGAGLDVPQHQYDYVSAPTDPLIGELRVDGDKSISHRAIMLGCLAKGITEIDGVLVSEDTLATLNMFVAMGLNVDRQQDKLSIKGVGLQGGLRKPLASLACGNSGTSARLMSGVLCGQTFTSYLHGDASLTRRPMRRVLDPLRQMGGRMFARNNECLPLFIAGSNTLEGITYTLPIASAQVKSAIMFAAIQARGETLIKEPLPTRDHTERMMKNFGYTVNCKQETIQLKGGGKLNAAHIRVPTDISSAAFFLVAASIRPGSQVFVRDVGINPGRTGIIRLLQAMGGKIDLVNARHYGSEPIADIKVQAADLKGVQMPKELVSAAIDELPALMIAAACAEGETVIEGAGELRVKESNRLEAMVSGLKQLGVKVQETQDGAIIQGKRTSPLQGGEVDSYGDHRIAMSFAVAGCVAEQEIHIRNCAAVATSFPNFEDCARSIGLDIKHGPSPKKSSDATGPSHRH